ncbi:hypothetical protein [Nevskia sp.]|uniref:hypothetical protein n=1 Tax=Nevskia sp. TaxID=1929292 RepID=UPI0025E95F7E|nr:hypothetical protein [Nevskia sp.]
MSLITRGLSLLAGAVLSLAAATASAQDSSGYEETTAGSPSAAAMTVDLLVARPLGLVATVLGTVVFVASLPFQALAGNVSDPARKLVAEPAKFTFVRPLGEGVN